MPTVSVTPADFHALLGRPLADDALVTALAAAKAEWKGVDEVTGQWRIELNDTNRPDLWGTEGIARQLRSLLDGKPRKYPVFAPPRSAPKCRIVVDARLRAVRPYIAAVRARGVAVTEPMLVALIQTQEKLAEGFGKRRRDASVGLYRAGKIRWPVAYQAVPRDSSPFVPLGAEQAMTPAEILVRHPKGVAYRAILEGHDVVPILRDAGGDVLSLAPIINSRALGEVQPGDDDLLVEVTGTNLRSVILVCNIFAANLTDRGFRCEPVAIAYPWETEAGSEVVTPRDFADTMTVDLDAMAALLTGRQADGSPRTPCEAAEVRSRLERYGCRVAAAGKGRLAVTCPPWRMDYLHPVDACEDYAMARGYGSFQARQEVGFTVGRLDATTRLTDRVRDHLIGAGFEETIGNVLTDLRTIRDAVRIGAPLPEPVRLANPTSEAVAAMRDRLLPGLLRLEGKSPRAAYPHRIFEVGDVQRTDPPHPHGSHTGLHCAATWAAPQVAFSDLHALLEALSRYLGWDVRLEAADFGLRVDMGDGPKLLSPGPYIEGRCAKIRFGAEKRGWIGEIHPEVLDAFGIRTPVVAFEVSLATMPEMA